MGENTEAGLYAVLLEDLVRSAHCSFIMRLPFLPVTGQGRFLTRQKFGSCCHADPALWGQAFKAGEAERGGSRLCSRTSHLSSYCSGKKTVGKANLEIILCLFTCHILDC